MGRSFSALLPLFLASGLYGQSGCPPLQAPTADPGKILFTPQQEMELGQIIGEQAENQFTVIDQDQVTGYLKRVGNAVVQQLPNTGLRYEFLVYDRPEIQAFSMPGGSVYVSRKMVAFLRSEDELAGVLGHELGHLAARQQALQLSRDFREILGVTRIAADEDISERYNELVDRFRLKKWHPTRDAESKQEVADQLGVQAVARAGYSPQALPDFMDRLMQTKGVTGNWFSDLVGATRPDSRRLRLILKDISSLPSACIEKRQQDRSDDEFQKWQSAVLHYRGIGHPGHLSQVFSRIQLKAPLRGDIEHFRFSPDGRYLLAQDEGGIYILNREPLQFVFRIDAPNAERAQFSPDSQQVVFFHPSLRVESWNIQHQEQTSMTDVPALRGCRQTALSADARHFACLGNDLSLKVYQVDGGETVFNTERFLDFGGYSGVMSYVRFSLYALGNAGLATLQFSPDGHYFAASSRTGKTLIVDLTTRKQVAVNGTLHAAMEYAFAFVGADRIIGIHVANAEKSFLVEFPSGKVLGYLPLGGQSLVGTTNANYVLVAPLKDHPVGAYDLKKKEIAFSNRMAATDVWGDFAVSERLNGEIGLYKVGATTPTSTLMLPIGKLGGLRTFAVSPDLKWMAISSRTRGGIWDVDDNTRAVLARGFREAYFQPGTGFVMDFPRFEKASREIGIFNPAAKRSGSHGLADDDDVILLGDVLLRMKHSVADLTSLHNIQMEALDTFTESRLWSRSYPKQGPWVLASSSGKKVILVWNARADGLPNMVSGDAKIQQLWIREKPGADDYLIAVLNTRDGSSAGGVVVHTGKYSFTIRQIDATKDWLAVTDNHGRVLLYSVSTGEQRARWFGNGPRVSGNGSRLCLANGNGRLTIYDLNALKQTAELRFADSVSGYAFSDDENKLFVLTNDQTAYVLDATGGQKN